MKKYAYFRYCVIVFVIVLPYLTGAAVNGPKTILEEKRPEPETYLPFMVSLQISPDMEKETIKAQTVIARSNLTRWLEEGKTLPEILGEYKEGRKLPEFFLKSENTIYEQAAKETRGKVLTSKGKVKLTPWHRISAGKTRNGKDVFHDQAYTYLRSVDSSQDKRAPEYIKKVEIPTEQLPENLEISERDQAGYVTELTKGEILLEGESFAAGLNLPSANFSLRKKEDVFVLRVRGCGHGLGFSQFGGNEMAKEGKTAEEILKKYFPAMKIEKMAEI